MKNSPKVKNVNPVAKNAHVFNRCRVMRDRKKTYLRKDKFQNRFYGA